MGRVGPTLAVLLISIFSLVKNTDASSSSSCELSRDWMGRWFHLGFPEPLVISRDEISIKGRCVQRSKNMFLMEESDPALGRCYRCMVIYEKHFNVLQYKESYCEENIESMDSLCNTITGDAPLYTMFRKDGDLVKCPFRGPHSFSYSKGDSGQVCKYPPSFMDTCSDNKRLQLRYQACMDVEGSEIATEEMACLATWKEGSSRYLVSMLNHSHVYTDEARYRCFVYQRQPNEAGRTTYKMAQSLFASCLGLWNVNEGYKTFTMTKLDSDKEKCAFPHFMHNHHDWHSVDGRISLHVNKRRHSLRLRNHTRLASFYGPEADEGYLESHVTCHKKELGQIERAGAEPHQRNSGVTRIVAHVKAGCDSGYVCLDFYYQDKHVIQMRYGDKSTNPNEACMNYYFDPVSSPMITLVSDGHNTSPCPFSGRYTLNGAGTMSALMSGQLNCRQAVMHAGCSTSDDLIIESVCSRNLEDNIHYKWSCHGQWRTQDNRQMLVLSTPSILEGQTSNFVCLSYTEQEGILTATASTNSCQEDQSTNEYSSFNITSSGPCLQALTGSAIGPAQGSTFLLFVLTVINVISLLRA